jgi:hypothetical protein
VDETAPRFVAPAITDRVGDLDLILSQPEMQSFWQSWMGPVVRDDGPNYAAAKAAMTMISLGSVGPYLRTALGSLQTRPDFQGVFDRAERRVFAKQFKLAPYSTVSRVAGKLGSCHAIAIEANIALLKALREEHPEAGIGKYLVIDGKAVPAWVPQRGSRGNADIEKRLRSRVPEAGFRAYVNTGTSKQALGSSDAVTVSQLSSTDAWRGYYLVALVDLATGLPVVWLLQDAAINETSAIVPLLSDLHRLWPDIGVEYLAGDSAWDSDEWCRLCEVDYGIHPVFRLHDEKRKGKLVPAVNARSKAFGFAGNGQVVCGPHRENLPFNTFEPAPRAGLRPGQSSKEADFRVRGICNHGPNPCQRVSVHCSHDWSSLTALPHYRQGNPKGYALRQALLTRLNAVESLFNRLEAGRLLGSDSGDRTRILSTETHESLISLALLGMTALTVTGQRMTSAPAAATSNAPWSSPLAA